MNDEMPDLLAELQASIDRARGTTTEGVELPEDFDMGRETSNFLVEIRTVLSRAETARRDIGENPVFLLGPTYGMKDGKYQYLDPPRIPHPGADVAIKALDDLIKALKPFERTGPRKKRRK